MKPVTTIASRTVVLPTRDIDTDQIIPARFLTTTSKEGLGKGAFHDLRYNADGTEKPGFPLNAADAQGCHILVAGNNFGCGSSREHASWALLACGLEAVISTEFADIFRNNALKNGLVAVAVDAATHEWLLDNPGANITIDVVNTELTLPDGRKVGFPLDGFARRCLLEGVDQLGFLLSQQDSITSFEETRPWKP